MSGSKKSTSQNTSTNTINPQQFGMLQGNYQTAQGNAAKLNTPYSGQLTAGFTPTQTQAQGILSGVATDPTYGAVNNQAVAGTQGILGNTVAPVNTATIAGADLSPYLNPYTQNVINTTIADQERARQIANVNNDQQASAAGAFGGSRSGVLNSLTNDAYDRNTGSLLAGLNRDNYNNAMDLAGQDVASQNNMGQFNANLGLQNNTQQLGAAGQLADLNNNGLSLATQQGGLLGAVGDAQQQQHQTELTNAYNAYLQGQQMTVAQQNLLNSALGMIPIQQTVNSSGTNTQTQTPGLTDYISAGGSLLSGIGAL